MTRATRVLSILVAFVLGVATMYYLERLNDISTAKAWWYEAQLQLESKDETAAIAILHQSLVKDRTNYFVYAQLGDIYHKQGNTSAALHMYKAALDVLRLHGDNEAQNSDIPKLETKIAELKGNVPKK